VNHFYKHDVDLSCELKENNINWRLLWFGHKTQCGHGLINWSPVQGLEAVNRLDMFLNLMGRALNFPNPCFSFFAVVCTYVSSSHKWLFRFLCWLAVVKFSFVNIIQVIGWEGWVFCTSHERLAGKIVSKITNNVLNGMLGPTYWTQLSLIVWPVDTVYRQWRWQCLVAVRLILVFTWVVTLLWPT